MAAQTMRLFALALALLLSSCTASPASDPQSGVPVSLLAPTLVPGMTCRYRYTATGEPLPDPACTPGSLNPAVSQDTISSTICVSGWTATVRPPSYYTETLNTRLRLVYHTTSPTSRTELDHLVPLELGGAPADVANLWPEPPDPDSTTTGVNNHKDRVENRLHSLVCQGSMSLDEARARIRSDWTTALP